MLGRGRPPARPQIISIRELTRAEIQSVKRSNIAPVQRFRDSHHRMARLLASGLRVGEVAELTGYSVSRVSLLYNTPAFQQLVADKRNIEDEVHRDSIVYYNAMILANGLKAERKLADKLDDDDEAENMSVRELISISRDSADRVGLSKRSISFNVSTDFAEMLDRAIKRSDMPRSGDLKLVPPIPIGPPEQTNSRRSESDRGTPKFTRRF